MSNVDYIPSDYHWSHDAKAAGWEGPGWYFWDAWEMCHGPYESEELAREASERYGEWLDRTEGGQ